MVSPESCYGLASESQSYICSMLHKLLGLRVVPHAQWIARPLRSSSFSLIYADLRQSLGRIGILAQLHQIKMLLNHISDGLGLS